MSPAFKEPRRLTLTVPGTIYSTLRRLHRQSDENIPRLILYCIEEQLPLLEAQLESQGRLMPIESQAYREVRARRLKARLKKRRQRARQKAAAASAAADSEKGD